VDQLPILSIDQTLFFQHPQNMGTKQLTQGARIDFRHDKEKTAFNTQPISHQGMNVRMVPGIIVKRLGGDDYTRYARLRTNSIAKKHRQARDGALAQFAKQGEDIERIL
jgi:hypothetical protein